MTNSMRTRIWLVVSFLLTGMFVKAQNCDCNKSLDSLKMYVEKNYAGAGDKITPETGKAYLAHTKKYRELIRKFGRNETYCLYLLHAWTRFFKDHHIQMGFSYPAARLKVLEEQREKLMLSPQKVIELTGNDSHPIEGVYYTPDSTYRVAVVKNKIGIRDYAGVIMTSKAPEWQNGQVKFELIQKEDGTFDAIWYNRAHHPSFSNIRFNGENGLQSSGWLKEGRNKNTTGVRYLFDEETKEIAYYRQLDDQTGYLRIQSFDGSFAKKIDSVIKANYNHINNQPYLVIDLRGNGGGSDFAYRPLKNLLYTNPVKTIGIDMLATPDNIQAWEEMLKDPAIPADFKNEFTKKMAEAKNRQEKMVNLFDDETDSSGTVQAFPKKVAVVINGRCGSTTEQFLLEARQSSKVVLVGKPSLGVLDYSNMREKKFFCPEYSLWYATTRSRRINAGQGIDNKGIAPDVDLDFNDAAWLQKAVDRLKKD